MAQADEAQSDSDFPLLSYSDELVDGLRKKIPDALKAFEEVAIHQARVSTRRLKASLDLLKPVLSKNAGKRFGRLLKKLRRRLGPLRDYDVMIGHLAELAKIRRHKAAANWLSDELTGRRKEARETASKKTAVVRMLGRLGAWWGLREEIVEAQEAIASLLAESLHLQLDAFAEQADRVAARAAGKTTGGPAKTVDATELQATDGIATLPTFEKVHVDPHELRIAGKALRYTLEMAAVEGHALPKKIGKTFKAMQESLGLWHDYVVLTDSALSASIDAMLSAHDPGLASAVLELSRLTLQRSVKELTQFSSLWREKGTEVVATIRMAFPLTKSIQEASPISVEPVKGSKTDPDPAGSASTSDPEVFLPAEPSTASA